MWIARNDLFISLFGESIIAIIIYSIILKFIDTNVFPENFVPQGIARIAPQMDCNWWEI